MQKIEIYKKELKNIVKLLDKTGFMNWFVDNLIIQGQEHFQEYEDLQLVYTPNHRSHLDYITLGYIFIKNNLPYPVFVAGKNLDCGFPVNMVLRFKKWGAWYLDRDKVQKGKPSERKEHAREIKGSIEEILNQGYNFLVFPDGGRNRTDIIMPNPKTGVLTCVHMASKKNPLYYVPIAIEYDRVIEGEYFEKLDKAKNKGTRLGILEYYFWDIWAFASRGFKKKGNVYINFGKPCLIDFKDRTDFVDSIQTDVRRLHSEIKNSLS